VGSQKLARRRPWLAGLLQVIWPGLGSLYSGRPARGLIIFLAVRCLLFVAIFTLLWLPEGINLVVFLLIILSTWIFIILDGVRSAKAAKADYTLAPYNRWYIYAFLVLGVGIVDDTLMTDFIRPHLFQAFQVSSPAMSPAVLPGDHLFADKTAYVFSEPRRGDLAIYRSADSPTTMYFDRIVGLPGETIEIRERVVLINGRKLDEPYVHLVRPPSNPALPGDSLPPHMIPADEYFVLGDNRDNSNDSRFRGSIKRQDIRGRAAGGIYFSRDPQNSEIRWNRIGKAID